MFDQPIKFIALFGLIVIERRTIAMPKNQDEK